MNPANKANVDMNAYYTFRKEIRKLYEHDTYYGDLAGQLLHIRDKYKAILSMGLAIQNFEITIELSANTEEKIKSKISNAVEDKIKEFILNNKKELNMENSVIDYWVNSYQFVDIVIVGDSITFNL